MAPGRTPPATPGSNRIREKMSNPDTDYADDWALFTWEPPPHSDNEARKRVLEWLREEFPDFLRRNCAKKWNLGCSSVDGVGRVDNPRGNGILRGMISQLSSDHI